MFINYISLMLINLVAGLFLLASYLYYGLDHANQKRWIPGFGITGAIPVQKLNSMRLIYEIGFLRFLCLCVPKMQNPWLIYKN
ncbi:DUF981 family protein [Scytonema sp. UIC 10036]|nr:DUF981 family protein [Scytonema sp. UIC 10036]